MQRILCLFTYAKIEYVSVAYVRVLQKIEYVRYVSSSLGRRQYKKLSYRYQIARQLRT